MIFIEKLVQSIENQTFIKLTLAKAVEKNELKNIYVRRVEIKKQLMLSFTYRYATRDEVKNYADTEGVTLIEKYAGHDFLNADLFTTTETTSVIFDKKTADFKISTKKNQVVETLLTAQHNREKTRLISSNALYLNALDITTKDGLVKNDSQHKYRQINRYIEIIDDLLRESPLPSDAVVADFGSGKGYLTFALYDHLTHNLKMTPSVFGFELREKLSDFCQKTAEKCQFDHLKFIAQDINDFKTNRLDMLIALHACDTATDIALAKGIQAEAEIIVVAPCCHKQIRKELQKSTAQNEMSPILRHGIVEERQAELLTDGIRALLLEANGYKTRVFEFISTEHTPKNVMIVGIKSQKNPKALAQVEDLKKHFGIGFHELEKLLVG